MKKIILITLASIGLSFLASSCVKEKGFDERVNEIVAAQLDSLNRQVAALEKTQAVLNDSLKNVKGDVEKLSKQSKSLTDSISVVKDTLAVQKEWTTEQLDAIGVRVKAIEEAQEVFMMEVYKRLGLLWNRIQKIDVIPQYSDGSVYMGKTDTVVNFIVRPDSVAQELVKAHSTGDSTFKFLAVKTLTKSDANVDTLDIKGVSYNGGIVSVRVNSSGLDSLYFEGKQSYSACLVIEDGNSDNTSGFFPLTPAVATANCYIVSKAGTYKLKAVKGNSDESVGDVAKAEVLWESYGTSTTPSPKDIISSVSYSDGKITYTVTDKKGNAVIAAKDGSGNVLWSWHIWCTDQPAEQEYNNVAGTMMDRNLGATSATKGEVGALGLLYQWGRKDPFLGADGITSKQAAASTLSPWPVVAAGDVIGASPNNLSYSIKNPTTYITNDNTPFDWYCTEKTYQNDSLWKISAGKTIYDPCPVGWRVPDGGMKSDGGVWAKAFDADGDFKESTGFSNGFDFGATTNTLVQSGTCCWYPAAGMLSHSDCSFSNVGTHSYYWSCTPSSLGTYYFYFASNVVFPVYYFDTDPYRAIGFSVRCLKEK